jgi:hypothetical protein
VTYEVKVELPGAPKGATVMIPGLGTFENGVPSEVEDEQVDLFVNFQNDTGEPRDLSDVVAGASHLSVKKKPATNKGGDK